MLGPLEWEQLLALKKRMDKFNLASKNLQTHDYEKVNVLAARICFDRKNILYIISLMLTTNIRFTPRRAHHQSGCN